MTSLHSTEYTFLDISRGKPFNRRGGGGGSEKVEYLLIINVDYKYYGLLNSP